MTSKSMPPYMVTMTLLIEGALQHEYWEGSCLSCGGVVLSIADKAGKLHDACEVCGPVVHLETENDAGAPLQGFLSRAELERCTPVPGLASTAPR